MAIGSFVCPDLGKKIGDELDLKDFGKYRITSIEDYYINENVTIETQPLFIYTLELTEKCTRELKDMQLKGEYNGNS